MDAPPAREDCRPFVHVAHLLDEAGVHAPRVIAADLARGYLLLSDLGTTTYAAALDPESARSLYSDAIDALIRWQRATRDDVLPPYDEALLARELALFPDWYVAKHLGHALSDAERVSLATVFAALLSNNLAQPRVFVHRDYHSRNLMVDGERLGVIDFQDALMGPATYDLASLLRDAYIALDEALIDRLIDHYLDRLAAQRHLWTNRDAFRRLFDFTSIQRNLKAAGRFIYIDRVKGNPKFLADIPRTLGYVKRNLHKYPELFALRKLMGAYVPELQ